MAIPSTSEPAAIHALRQAHVNSAPPSGHVLPPGFRERIAFDFTDCPHTEQQLMDVQGWDLSICVRCGHTDIRVCSHIDTEWLFDGKLLVCKNCGIDCT